MTLVAQIESTLVKKNQLNQTNLREIKYFIHPTFYFLQKKYEPQRPIKNI